MRVLNIILFLAFIGSLGAYALTDRDLSQRNFEAFPDMAHAVAYDTYAPNPNFPDGKTFQLPEAGTIARGSVPLHYEGTPQDAVRAGEELTNPYSMDNARARERGAFVYTNYCQFCHGPQGKGDGPVSKRGMPLPASLATADNPVKMKDGQMFHVLTFGWRNMPAQAGQLSQEDRWKVILHVRSLQQRAAAEKQQ
jgi:mono/diheme cytochrome c family protein